MKKLTLTFLAVLLTTAFAMAQAQVGLRAGYNVSTIADDQEFENGDELWRGGLVAGIATNFRVNELFSIAPELLYEQRGRQFDFDSDAETKIRYNYLSLPILARVQFGDVLKGYVNLGPTFSYWLGGKYRQEGTIFGVNYDIDEDFKFVADANDPFEIDEDDANRLEIGGAVGGGIMLDTGAGSFLIDLRYTAGFNDMIKDTEGGKYKNQNISVSLIFLVPSVK